MGRKVVRYAVGAVALWIVVLVIFGFLYGGRAGDKVASRVGDSLAATVTVEDSNLALVRGHLELTGIAVRKDDVGHLSIDIGDIRCDLPPLGLALIDRECRDLVIDKVRLEVSTLAVFKFKKPKRKPFRVRRVEINDAVLAFSPTAFLPELGKIEIAVEYVEAGPTVFKTPMSWIFSMKELRATLTLPANIVMTLHYKDGVLRAAGGVFGSTPVELPFSIPITAEGDDAQIEIKKLVQLGKQLAEELVEKRAKDWLRSKLPAELPF
ncbi:MAG: hypothetical protein H0T42_09005 [Deltaproteobacteria bacterium]|nr:hypothetical protein [Deltaproteobacteria bacterium]